MRRILFMTLLFCLSLVLLLAGTAWTAQSGEMTIHPEVLEIGTFYTGSQVTISGEVSREQDVVVEIAGPASNGEFDLKGRVGPFWMTRDRAEMDGAPTIYVLLLPGGQDWRRKAASLGLDLENLRSRISIQSAALPPEELFNMFLELKKSQGLYVVQDKAVTYVSAENGRRRFTAVYCFPSSMVRGKYTIRATAIANGAKDMEQSTSFLVNEVGFARLIDDLATNQRLLYGILAVVIALFSGALMGILFKGGRSH